uniref:Cytochrome c oxidase subunit 3 n=1 Tax=Ibidoecus plataleae TaxID=3004258 RepID=A0A9E9ETQ6_9NEOP|nr:cytochrome c oxidase subunit III [Ibidoecus plataleae]
MLKKEWSKFHPYHILDISPWPVLSSLSVTSCMLNLFFFMSMKTTLECFIISMVSLVMSISLWWRDVIRESTFQGNHTKKVQTGIRMGFVLFILSEVMFFMSFFWGIMSNMLVPDVELGCMWPPVGVQSVDYLGVPLLNTIILISSGVSVTWAHHSLISSNKMNCLYGFLSTVILGVLFTYFQLLEYYDTSFTICDSVYGSLFFTTTGFHGLHVAIGTVFLTVCFFRVMSNHFSNEHHVGAEAAIWYWHFVDVVWLFLYLLLYCMN